MNNAVRPGGQGRAPRLDDITSDLLWDELNTKGMGYLRCAQAGAPRMREQGWGRIINISGLPACQTGSTIGTIRNVSVAAMTKNLADELGHDWINVTVVRPGLTRTEAPPAVLSARAEASGTTLNETERVMGGAYTIGRFIESEEVAWIVAFLASSRASAITGDAITTGVVSRAPSTTDHSGLLFTLRQMSRIPNGTWIALVLVAAVGLSIGYALLGGDAPLIDRNRDDATPTAVVRDESP